MHAYNENAISWVGNGLVLRIGLQEVTCRFEQLAIVSVQQQKVAVVGAGWASLAYFVSTSFDALFLVHPSKVELVEVYCCSFVEESWCGCCCRVASRATCNSYDHNKI